MEKGFDVMVQDKNGLSGNIVLCLMARSYMDRSEKKNLSVEDVSCCNLMRTFESARFRMSLGIHAVHIATSYSTIAKKAFFSIKIPFNPMSGRMR